MGSSTGSTLFFLMEYPDDGDAWRRFVERYGPMLKEWCTRRGMQSNDAEEVTQEVLYRLIRAIASYDRSRGRFRPWLRGVAAKVWYDIRKKQAKAGYTTGTGESEPLVEHQREAEEEFQRLVNRILDIELFERASEIVQLRVEPRTWKMFHAVVLEEVAVKTVAQQYGLTGSGVYRAVYRVKAVFEEVIRGLEG